MAQVEVVIMSPRDVFRNSVRRGGVTTAKKAARIHNELSGNVSTIQSMLALMMEKPMSPEAQKIAGEIRAALEMQETTVKDAIDLYREREAQAYHDPLTGLPNELYMNDELDKTHSAIKRANYDGQQESIATLVKIDLGGLKAINEGRIIADQQGLNALDFDLDFEAGNTALKAIAQALEDFIRSDEWAFRFGGDEFAVLVQHSKNSQTDLSLEEQHDHMMERLKNHLDGLTFRYGQYEYPVTLYVGESIMDGIKSVDRVLNEADWDLQKHKKEAEHSRTDITALLRNRVYVGPELTHDPNAPKM